jgi:CheY-like chemotaxis protein
MNSQAKFEKYSHIRILLADDDLDDRFFFSSSLSELSTLTRLTTVNDGEILINYLSKNSHQLPDVLFLDLNMPRKNGLECLTEIKRNKKLEQLPVIIYSTSLHDAVADELYNNGAHYYIRKTDFTELKKMLQLVLTMIVKNKFNRPSRDKFVLSMVEIS